MRLLQDLYLRQEAVVRLADGKSDPEIIGWGIRQGCLKSSDVLNLCKRYNDRSVEKF